MLRFQVFAHLYGQESHRGRGAVQPEGSQGDPLFRRRSLRNVRKVVKSAASDDDAHRTKKDNSVQVGGPR